MKLFLLIVEDRHTDVLVFPFSNEQMAINEAKRIAKERCRDAEDYEEHPYGKDDGWLFYANYSCESDSVRVVEAQLDYIPSFSGYMPLPCAST